MKSIRRILPLCLVALMLCGCNATKAPEQTTAATQKSIDPNVPLCNGKTLKLLAITSSFGLNTTQLLYDAAVAEGFTDVVIGRLYGSGCTLQKHVENTKSNAAFYQYTKNNSGSWQTMDGISMQYGLQDEDWDIIFIQQSAAQSPQPQSYGNYIDELMPYVKENITNPNAKFVWNMLWAYQHDSDDEIAFPKFDRDQMKMYEANISTTKEKIVPRTDFHAIIPSGTAIQNARTSFMGDTLTKDGMHLNTMGRAIAAYTVLAALTKQQLTQVNLTDIPKSSAGDTDPLTLTDAQKAVIIEAVNNAMANPFNVTNSVITTQP